MKSLAVLLLLYITTSYANDVRFCSIGMGKFGRSTAKLAIGKGFKMVAAFTRYSKHLKNVGQLLGIEDESLSFHVSAMNKLEEIIDKTKPQFCIDATNSTLADVFPHFRRLIAKGVHILTLADEAVFPNTRFNWKPRQLYRALDKISKENNVVILGGGYSDSILIPVIPSIAASMMKLNRVKISIRIDVDSRGENTVRRYGVGMTEKEFNEAILTLELSAGHSVAHWQRSIVEAIAYMLGLPLLDVKDGAQQESIALYTRKECYKVMDENGLASNALNDMIANGDCGGMNVTVLGRAKDDVDIIFSVVIGVISDEEDIKDIQVVLNGTPDIEFSIDNVDSVVATGASLLHRVPMVLNELSPGFHNVNDLKANKYWSKVQDWNEIEEEFVEKNLDSDKKDL